MTPTSDDVRDAPSWAHIASEVLAPWILAAVMPILVSALTTDPVWRGVLLGALVTFLCAVVPYAIVAIGVRRGRYESHHVRRREDRPALLAMVAGFTALTFVLLVLLDASRGALVFLGLMTACVGVGFAVSRSWKISLHAMVVAASAVSLAGLVPVTWPVLVAIPLVCAARVRLRAHTVAQVVVGAATGSGLAAVALFLSST